MHCNIRIGYNYVLSAARSHLKLKFYPEFFLKRNRQEQRQFHLGSFFLFQENQRFHEIFIFKTIVTVLFVHFQCSLHNVWHVKRNKREFRQFLIDIYNTDLHFEWYYRILYRIKKSLASFSASVEGLSLFQTLSWLSEHPKISPVNLTDGQVDEVETVVVMVFVVTEAETYNKLISGEGLLQFQWKKS